MIEKLKELEKNEEFMKELEATTDGEQIEALFKSQGLSFSYEDLEKMGFGVETGELDESQLTDVAGGYIAPRIGGSYSYGNIFKKLAKYLFKKLK